MNIRIRSKSKFFRDHQRLLLNELFQKKVLKDEAVGRQLKFRSWYYIIGALLELYTDAHI